MTRELATIAALAARPETKPQMTAHIAIGKINGVTDAQAAAIVARVQRPAKPEQLPADWSPIPVGNLNTGFAKYFIGNSYLHKLTLDQVPVKGLVLFHGFEFPCLLQGGDAACFCRTHVEPPSKIVGLV